MSDSSYVVLSTIIDFVVGEAKMTKIFAVYLQAYGFPSYSSEYAFGCRRKQVERYDICLLYSSTDVALVPFFV